MDLPDNGSTSESEESLEHYEQSSDEDMKNDDQEDHAEENVNEEIETEKEETEDPVAPEEATVRVTRNLLTPRPRSEKNMIIRTCHSGRGARSVLKREQWKTHTTG